MNKQAEMRLRICELQLREKEASLKEAELLHLVVREKRKEAELKLAIAKEKRLQATEDRKLKESEA
jgi:hypothetical protein